MMQSPILVNQAANEVSRLSNFSKKDIDSLDFISKKILIIDTCNSEDCDNYHSKIEKILKRNPYFCDINFTHFYGNNSFLITSLSIYGKRIYYRIVSFGEKVSEMVKYVRLCEMIKKNYEEYQGFVIIHNYETICYTASFLSFMLENLRKIVVLTGSQLPMEVLKNDASSNLLNALIFAGHFAIPEVLVCFRDKIFRGNRSQICDSVGFDCVASPNFPVLATLKINILLKKDQVLKYEDNPKELSILTKVSENCVVVKLNPFLTTELLNNILKTPNLKGLVLETYGFGQITIKNHTFMKTLGDSIEKNNLIVLNISQAFSYNLESSQYGKDYERLGIINGGDMTIEASLAKLSYLIGKGFSKEIIIEKLRQNLKGEITCKIDPELFSYKENILLHAITNPLENQSQYTESLEKLLFPSLVSHACKLGYLSLLKQLSKSTNITIPEILEGKSPLHAATAQDNPELVIFLLKEGCGVNVEDSHGRTALYEAIRTKNKVIAKVLIGAGGLVRGNKEEITNLLLNACAKNDLDLIKLVFHSGLTDLNQYSNVELRNLGHVAACGNHLDIVNFLWKVVNFDFSEKDIDGKTPLDDAKFFKHEDIIKILDPLDSIINK